MEDSVLLKVNGREFRGWKRVSVTAGLDRQARDFELDITFRWPDRAAIRDMIRPGDSCQILLGRDLVLTGYVDTTPIRYDAGQISVGVSGRSATADLVDCAAINEPGQWNARRVEDIVTDLAAPYGVHVCTEVNTGPIVETYQIDQGETVFESVDRLIGMRALLSTDDANGRLVLTGTGRMRAITPLILGQNILSADAPLNWKDRYSLYLVKGQGIGDDSSVHDALSVRAEAHDAAVRRRRVLFRKQSGDADRNSARLEARWEAASRAGQSVKTRYTVQGWRQADGSLWVPNAVVSVQDPVIGLDGEMLIGEVTYSLGDTGCLCHLTVAPTGAWELKPETTQKRGDGPSALTRPGETLLNF